jgi:hypothetical protein
MKVFFYVVCLIIPLSGFSQNPDAPVMNMAILGDTINGTLQNDLTGNNANQDYAWLDPFFDPDFGFAIPPFDSIYRFEGFIVYQTLGDSLSSSDLHNVNLSRPVFQCDIQNGIAQIIDYLYDSAVGVSVPVQMVNASDMGVDTTFKIWEDAFTGLPFSGEACFTVVSYAFNSDANKHFQMSDSITFVCLGALNLEEHVALKLKSFPNPSTGLIQIEYSSGLEIEKLIVTDIVGNVVKSVNLNSKEGRASLDLSNQNSGIYFCSLVSGSRKLASVKVVLAR